MKCSGPGASAAPRQLARPGRRSRRAPSARQQLDLAGARRRRAAGTVSEPCTAAPWRGAVELQRRERCSGRRRRGRAGGGRAASSCRRRSLHRGRRPACRSARSWSGGGVVWVAGWRFAGVRDRDRAAHRGAVDGAVEGVGAGGGEVAGAAPVPFPDCAGSVPDRHRRLARGRRRAADPVDPVRSRSSWRC